MNLMALVFSQGWASGVNAYLVVLVLGLSDRFGHFEQIPNVLGRTDVLVVAGVLYAGEFVADKIPYVDSTWDAVSTFIRPTVSTVIAAMLAGHVSDTTGVQQIAYSALGGGTALASHAVKSGTRLAINTSPEPFTNIVASFTEDGLVLGVVMLAIHHPYVALGISGTLLVVGLVVLWFVLKLVRRGWRRWKGRDPVTGARPTRA